MPNNKDNPKGGSKGSMPDTSDREFDSQGKNKGFGGGGQQAGGSGKGTGSPGAADDDMTTAGGKQGQFSDKNRGSEAQWSPGSTQESDR